ncbi:MAG TPA: IS4 family transposase [Cyclobacteriaceae bacterium]|nr:IS4 family transposase [Cyclobacteriaceae bacterium]
MNKSNYFSGQPTFLQLIRLVPKDLIAQCIDQSRSDHYYKKFNTWHHLVTMLFTCYAHCHSLREVVTGMRAFEGRLQGCGIRFFPTRSTFAEANANRDSIVFERIYMALKKHWDSIFPDSRANKSVYIIDSTTIKLFQAIFKGSGLGKENGRRKGGLKVHMAVQQKQFVPSIIHLSQAASNDVTFTKHLDFSPGSTVIMDGGYRSYRQYNEWTTQRIRWVTRLHPHSYYQVKKKLPISGKQKRAGVNKDALIVLGAPYDKIPKVPCRLIRLISPESKRTFEFITNDVESTASYIGNLYRKRWSIEVLFKRLKQNMPLQYFLGDNQNAIKIQVWCALIADLLLQIVKKQVKHKWAFSNIVNIVRLHLFNYLNLFSFLEHPDKAIITTTQQDFQFKLALSG